ncbi:Toprim domain-containing protein [Azospirillum oryzae]|uniref:Toprim domain-containing protein n=1 Tax=Azospirillum oryzae TaxID=286727 RepID=A0A1X7HBE5_9PROT|nr:primase-helicase family protein [Azospirillum oryzae]SMF83294.1 Toprim domain-containing protein [Azospirillum oryzae]
MAEVLLPVPPSAAAPWILDLNPDEPPARPWVLDLNPDPDERSRRSARAERDEIDAALRDQVEALVTHLRGGPNPALSTDTQLRYGTKGSLHVCVAGKEKGRITDFEAGGEKGMGPIDFIMAERMLPVGEALRWAADWLGLQPPPPTRPEVVDEGEPTDTSAWARQQWGEATSAAGTVAERYLVDHRGIALEAVERLVALDLIRFHPGHRASSKPGSRSWSAILFPIFDQAGELQAIQAVRLNPVTGRKITGTSKISNGPLAGHGLMLPGDGGVILAEGPENGISAWQETGRPVLIAFGGIVKVQDWPPAGAVVTVLADGDAVGSAAAKSRAKACDAMADRGVTVLVTDTPDGMDANKLLLDPAAGDLLALINHPLHWSDPAPVAEAAPTAWQPVDGDLSARIGALTKDTAANDPAAITAVLSEIAASRMDPIQQRGLLERVKRQTGMSVQVLEKGIKATRKQAIANREGFADICKRYVYVKATDCFWDRVTCEMVTLQSVRNHHWRDMPAGEGGPISPLEVMLQDPHHGCDRADSVTFLPRAPTIIEAPGGLRQLNMWTPPDVAAIAGDVTPLLDHLWYILDQDPAAVEFVLDYLAHLVQFPEIKMRKCVLIIGVPGIGKSIVYEWMMRLLGPKNCTPVEESDLRSQFNDWADGVQLIVVHELMAMEHKEVMNRLKNYITDPTIRINRKQLATYRYENRANFLMASNHRDAAQIEKGDRRYFIWHSKARPRPSTYYDALGAWFDNGGAEAMLHFLATRPLDRFNPFSPAPLTQAKAEIIEESRAGMDGYLHEAWETERAPFQHDLVTVNDVIDFMAKDKKISLSHKKVSLFLRSIGAELLGNKRLDGGRQQKVWAIRDQERWMEAPERAIALAYRSAWTLPDE